ncbi:hypothetical protein IOC57_06570 [Bacillus sp. SD075]|uniref:hypothetical protein n=1 Tax=Bacillus sp. SD075 TaxID=2781732 RepID=UPI001A9586D1|nr:hypothetical protein [Bacillus sp. SD075]MBO0997416.1 hypothetical protein [Bacillus sp. SD075]
MEIKYEDLPSILMDAVIPFMKTYLRRKSLNRMLQVHEKREQALILQRIEGLFTHINFSFEFAIVQLLLFMVFCSPS